MTGSTTRWEHRSVGFPPGGRSRWRDGAESITRIARARSAGAHIGSYKTVCCPTPRSRSRRGHRAVDNSDGDGLLPAIESYGTVGGEGCRMCGLVNASTAGGETWR
ncbi:hypothetical protein DENSPDRAFT_241690 [Dentipellis sp. KUC8613]|nr:hypothetical protein DENSPDRAFT_241690 [Dentipellis sp. KUC8613]